MECTGSPLGLKTALNLVHPRGIIVFKSTYAEKPKIDLSPIVIDEITLIGSRCGPFPPAIQALADKTVDVRPLISQTFTLEKGIEALDAAKQKNRLKVVLHIE